MSAGDNIIGGGRGYPPPPPLPKGSPGVTLNPLPDDLFALSVTPPSFSQLAADTLGNAATETDGFDATLQDIALALASESDGLSALAADVEEAAFAVGAFEAESLAPTALDLAASVTNGDDLIGDLVHAIGSFPAAPADTGVGG